MTTESETTPSRGRSASLILLGMNMLGVLFLIFVGLVIAPKFKAMFTDLMDGTASLPALTRLFIMQPPSVYIAFGVAFAGFLILKEFLIDSKSVTFTINFAAIVFQLLVTTVIVISCFLPMTSMIQNMSGSAAPPAGVQTTTP